MNKKVEEIKKNLKEIREQRAKNKKRQSTTLMTHPPRYDNLYCDGIDEWEEAIKMGLEETEEIKNETGYVAYHERDGVFLGLRGGMALFSNAFGTKGKSAAVLGGDVTEIVKKLKSVLPKMVINELEFVEVEIDEPKEFDWASMKSCVAAGLPSWDSNDDSVWADIALSISEDSE